MRRFAPAVIIASLFIAALMCLTLYSPADSYSGGGGGGGSGDITGIGNVTSGSAFDGTAGYTLTFDNAGGDGVLSYDGTSFTTDKPLQVRNGIQTGIGGTSDGTLTFRNLGTAGGKLILSQTANTDEYTWTWPTDVNGTFAGIDLANAWGDGVKQTFNPSGTTAGLNAGSVAGDPSVPANGDIWYDSVANELTGRINGANVALGGGGSFDATAVDAVTWSDGANASNLWTFNVSGTDPTITIGSNNFIFGAGSVDLGATGVRLTNDADGALTFLGLSAGADEDFTLNFDDTADKIVASSSTGAAFDLSGMTTNIGPLQGSEGSPLHVRYFAVGSGTAYTMTATYATVDMGTVDPSITIAATGTYRVYASVQLNYANATYAAFNEATFRIYRTNNTPGIITADAERGCSIPIMTTTTMIGDTVVIGPVEYTTTNTDDAITIQGDLNAVPGNSPTGNITVTKATIWAERIVQ